MGYERVENERKDMAHMRRLISRARKNWNTNSIRPYCEAYIDAVGIYKAEIKKQQKIDEAQAKFELSLLMIALSVCGGGLLTTIFGKPVIKEGAAHKFIDVIFNREFERTIDAVAIVEKNPCLQFLVGKSWDTLSNFVSEETKKRVENNTEKLITTSAVQKVLDEPLKVLMRMQEWSEVFEQEAVEIATDISISNLSRLEKVHAFNLLLGSKFFTNAPTVKEKKEVHEKNILLSFYMSHLLQMDYLESGVFAESKYGRRMTPRSRKPINSVTSDKNYPELIKRTENGYQKVGYHDTGDSLDNAIDKAYGENPNFSGKFFKVIKSDIGFSSREKVNRDVIVRAETVVHELGKINRIRNKMDFTPHKMS